MEKWMKRSLIVIVIVVAIVPLGILVTWDKTAYGEWSEINDNSTGTHWTPQSFFKGLLPDYNVDGWSSKTMASIGYYISAILGVTLTGLTIYFVSKYMVKRSERKNAEKSDNLNKSDNLDKSDKLDKRNK